MLPLHNWLCHRRPPMGIKRFSLLSLYLMGPSLQLPWLKKLKKPRPVVKEQSVIRRRLLPTVVALCLVLSSGGIVSAQTYPQRTIKIVVPFPAGGANDTVARVLAQALSSRLGQPVI